MPPRFVIDSMLGTISKKLRIFGFDCLYYNNISDDELIMLAKKDSRTIITRDEHLANKAKKHGVFAIYLAKHTEREQLVEVAKKAQIPRFHIDTKNARCPCCNGILHQAQKQVIQDRLPPNIVTKIDEFWSCQNCGHIYWEGTHIKNLDKLISEINESL